jgi:hypothetical protein
LLGRTTTEFLDPEEVVPEFWARLAPDCELHERRELPDAMVYRGPAAAKEFFRKTQDWHRYTTGHCGFAGTEAKHTV